MYPETCTGRGLGLVAIALAIAFGEGSATAAEIRHAAPIQRVALYKTNQAVLLYYLEFSAEGPHLYTLAISTNDKEHPYNIKAALSRQRSFEGNWKKPEHLGKLSVPRPAVNANTLFAITELPGKPNIALYTMAGVTPGSAGIIPHIEYPLLSIGCAITESGVVPPEPEHSKKFEMQFYGPIRLAGVARLKEDSWLVMSDSGYIFEAYPSEGETQTPAPEVALPATTRCGMRVQMVGGLENVADMSRLEAGAERKEREDKARCHGCGQPRDGIVPLLCTRYPGRGEQASAGVLEIHTVTLNGEKGLASAVAAKADLPTGMSSPIVLALHPAQQGELWWCFFTAGKKLTVGCYDGEGTISWQNTDLMVDGTLLGGFVDSKGAVRILFAREHDEGVEIVEGFLGNPE